MGCHRFLEAALLGEDHPLFVRPIKAGQVYQIAGVHPVTARSWTRAPISLSLGDRSDPEKHPQYRYVDAIVLRMMSELVFQRFVSASDAARICNFVRGDFDRLASHLTSLAYFGCEDGPYIIAKGGGDPIVSRKEDLISHLSDQANPVSVVVNMMTITLHTFASGELKFGKPEKVA